MNSARSLKKMWSITGQCDSGGAIGLKFSAGMPIQFSRNMIDWVPVLVPYRLAESTRHCPFPCLPVREPFHYTSWFAVQLLEAGLPIWKDRRRSSARVTRLTESRRSTDDAFRNHL